MQKLFHNIFSYASNPLFNYFILIILHSLHYITHKEIFILGCNYQGTNTLSRKYSTARFIVLTRDHIPSFTEKQAFLCAALQSWGLCLGIVEPCNATRLPILQFCAEVVTYICARGHAYSHSTWVENIANIWLPYTNIWETSFKGASQTSSFDRTHILIMS